MSTFSHPSSEGRRWFGEAPEAEDILCFSPLRWKLGYQRPQHLLTRAAGSRRVTYVEEPQFDVAYPCLEANRDPSGVIVLTPHVPRDQGLTAVQTMLDFYLSGRDLNHVVAWYYSPTALRFSAHVRPAATVYDCMDDLSTLASAPAGFPEAERALLARADLVLAGGHSLYLAKRALHANTHEVPGSVDIDHFGQARLPNAEAADQAAIPHPRIGFVGVVDERLDRDLLASIAAASPEWHFVLIGPLDSIDRTALPLAPNLHYLGPKAYDELPAYIAGWEVAMLPFARGEATRFISPARMPEYLAAGRPVVSTSISDIVHPYGDEGLAWIADTPADFTAAIRSALCNRWSLQLPRVDAYLVDRSWDLTWLRIAGCIRAAVLARRASGRANPQPRGAAGISPRTH